MKDAKSPAKSSAVVDVDQMNQLLKGGAAAETEREAETLHFFTFQISGESLQEDRHRRKGRNTGSASSPQTVIKDGAFSSISK